MPKTVWKYKYLAQAYELIKGGMSERKTAQVLGISFWTLKSWKKKKPYFKSIVREARRACRGNGETVMDWHDYVYHQLSDEMKEVWRRINHWDSIKNGVERIEVILADRGLRVRQSLFIHAWVVSNFSISQALRKVNVSRGTFKLWKNNDPGFAALTEDIQWYYKNWVQDQLTRLICMGDTTATVFANRTLNADRFPDKRAVDMNVQGSIQHNVIDVDSLDLDLKTKKILLKAIRNQNNNNKNNNDNASE